MGEAACDMSLMLSESEIGELIDGLSGLLPLDAQKRPKLTPQNFATMDRRRENMTPGKVVMHRPQQ
jgi:hypothetical protein